VGLVGFAILQPFIWEVILNRKAPALSNDFAGITTIIVTIMALAFAGFGVVVYQLAEKHSEASLQERAKELEDNILMHGAAANSKLYINISYQAFLSYDELWRQRSYRPTALEKEDKNNWELLRFLDSAIDNARQALKQYLDLSEQLRSKQESANGLINCRCNYAYFLATRLRSDGRIDDRERALDIVRQLDQDRSKRNLHVRETVAWIYLRCCDPGDSLWERGLQELALALSVGGWTSRLCRRDIEVCSAERTETRSPSTLKRRWPEKINKEAMTDKEAIKRAGQANFSVSCPPNSTLKRPIATHNKGVA